MSEQPLPVLWLCGAPGVGKSTVAWTVFTDLAAEGVLVGYVDIDQLGMLQPPPANDPDLHRTKVENLAALIPGFRAAGARAMIVSGVIDAERGVDFSDRAVEIGAITFCHLTIDEETLRRRLVDRGWPVDAGDTSMADMAALSRADFVTSTMDTTGRTPEELAVRARELLTPLSKSSPSAFDVHGDGPPGDVTLVCGPRAVGKSTVSWSAFVANMDDGVCTGFVDLEQISFLEPDPADGSDRRALRTRNLAALQRTFAAQGASHLIANGMVDGPTDAEAIRAALAPVGVQIVRLAADETTYRRRIAEREAGGPARLIGDDLLQATSDHQHDVLKTSLAQQNRDAATPFGDITLDTTDDSPAGVARHLRALTTHRA